MPQYASAPNIRLGPLRYYYQADWLVIRAPDATYLAVKLLGPHPTISHPPQNEASSQLQLVAQTACADAAQSPNPYVPFPLTHSTV